MKPENKPEMPSRLDTLRALAGVTWIRMRRGKALWIGGMISVLPILHAVLRSSLVRGGDRDVPASELAGSITPVLILLPALFAAGTFADELESRTATYLWSRPIARAAVLAGKLCTIVPLIAGFLIASWAAASAIGGHAATPLACLALALGGLTVSLAASAIAILSPRHAMALTISYLLTDTFVGALPFSIAQLSITFQVRTLAGLGDAPAVGAPIVALAVLGAVWGAIAVWRIGRREL
ncbi:MAG TPA: ABC transporter permease [Kofleriaceae bacterium]|nr:ABC transporter permease [Kofleriaceae bacterium]